MARLFVDDNNYGGFIEIDPSNNELIWKPGMVFTAKGAYNGTLDYQLVHLPGGTAPVMPLVSRNNRMRMIIHELYPPNQTPPVEHTAILIVSGYGVPPSGETMVGNYYHITAGRYPPPEDISSMDFECRPTINPSDPGRQGRLKCLKSFDLEIEYNVDDVPYDESFPLDSSRLEMCRVELRPNFALEDLGILAALLLEKQPESWAVDKLLTMERDTAAGGITLDAHQTLILADLTRPDSTWARVDPVLAALQAGINIFEGTLGGIGGQPANFLDRTPVPGTGAYYYRDPNIVGLVSL